MTVVFATKEMLKGGMLVPCDMQSKKAATNLVNEMIRHYKVASLGFNLRIHRSDEDYLILKYLGREHFKIILKKTCSQRPLFIFPKKTIKLDIIGVGEVLNYIETYHAVTRKEFERVLGGLL